MVTTEIASGRFEDDIRRMRMAAWHGADHLMVIRTTGQSHIDGLMEGTPEGTGGVPITRKQIRASRKACDLIEDEVGRPINFHCYVSGVAGPEVAVLFAEEGINGAHQDPQYNVLYRNVNMYRSFVDAAEAKSVMAGAGIFQIDGAHNANATAKAGWLVMPELMVQHGINCAFSVAAGMDKRPDRPLHRAARRAPGAQALVRPALRRGPARLLLRIQDARPAEHALHRGRHRGSRPHPHRGHADLHADQRRHPVHHHPGRRPQRALALQQHPRRPDRQADLGRPGRHQRTADASTTTARWARWCAISRNAPWPSWKKSSRSAAISPPWKKASSWIPPNTPSATATASPATARAAWAPATIVAARRGLLSPRSAATSATTTCRPASKKACDPIDGCTLCKPEKIVYIDELDPEDTCDKRLEKTLPYRKGNLIKPEAEWAGDGTVLIQLFVPQNEEIAPVYARGDGQEDGPAGPGGRSTPWSCTRPKAASWR